jgi:protein-S-isoprenylcysteine O-methyltransferase Ste14
MHAGRVIHILWAILITYWIISAFGNKRTKTRQGRGSRLAYVLGVAGAVYLISLRPGLDVWLLPVNAFTRAAGVLICAAGVAIAIWARNILGKNWSGFVMIKQDHELIERGPYRFVRHPIYTGIILAIVGTVIALVPTAKGFLYALVLALAFYIKSRHEEHVLAGEFGEKYAGYKQRVGAALVPFVI